MSSLLIRNAKVIAGEKILEGYAVYCENGKIVHVRKDSDEMSADVEVDADGKYIAPGFIDLHMHGAHDISAESSKQGLGELLTIMPRYGVTAMLAGVCPHKSDEAEIERLEEFSEIESEGTQLLGFFLEGHFLTLFGAIAYIPEDRSKKRVVALKKAASPKKIAFAISPELENITELLPEMVKDGYPAFITHTGATHEQTEAAIAAGATHATHFYNVFPDNGDKEPGVRACGTVEAIYANPDVTVDFIMDGEHVEPIAVRMALACKDKSNVCIISDSNVNAGLPPGEYKGVGGKGLVVAYEGGPARMTSGELSGTLSGSGLTLDRGLRNAMKMTGVGLTQAVAMVSYNPSKVLGLHERKGRIEEGYDADMVMLDEELNVSMCWVGADCKYKRD